METGPSIVGLVHHIFVCRLHSVQAVLQNASTEESHRTWVIQEDQDSLFGPELVLRAWRASCTGQDTTAVAPWAEVDSQGAIFGVKNDMGAAREVVQQPGQLLALQVAPIRVSLRAWSAFIGPIDQ